MSKITRATQQIFAGQVLANNNIAQFGSLKASSANYSLDPAVIQGLTGYGQGWAGAIVANQAPALQDMNALDFLITRQLAYIMQAGVPEYDASTTYYIGSTVNDGLGNIFVSLVDGAISTPSSASIVSLGLPAALLAASTTWAWVRGSLESVAGSAENKSSGHYGDGGCLPILLGAGAWDLQSCAYITSAQTFDDASVFIGTVTGDDSTGRDFFRNLAKTANANAAGTICTLNTPVWRVTVPAGTTQNYYAKTYASFTGGGNFVSMRSSLFARRAGF